MDSASTKYSGAYRQWKGENRDENQGETFIYLFKLVIF